VISKLLVITEGCRFCNSKETDNDKYIIHVGSYCSLGLTAKVVCNQPNFSRVFFSLRDNSANPNISRFFCQPSVFFQIADWGSIPKITERHTCFWFRNVCIQENVKRSSAVAETTRCFVTLYISLSHSKI